MKVDFFMPQYMESFRCIGPECKDTCCAGWEINIDKNTFLKYKNSNGTLSEIVKGKYHENPVHNDDLSYGFMNVENSKCPFLNEKMLCDIHGNSSEEDLSITCKRYPRVYNIVDGIYEKCGVASCEEVCIKAFLNKEKMEFIESSEEIDEETIHIRRLLDTEIFTKDDDLIQYFWDLRIASINIMQNREFSIDERLNILKEVYTYILDLKKMKNLKELDKFISNISEKVDLNKFNKSYNKVNLKEILFSDKIFNEIKGVNLKGLLLEYKQNSEINNKKEKLCSKYDYIIENYLVNQIFKNIIPFSKGEHLDKSIQNLINNYNIIETYIDELGKCTEYIDGENFIIKVIQAVSKDLEHNKIFEDILEMN